MEGNRQDESEAGSVQVDERTLPFRATRSRTSSTDLDQSNHNGGDPAYLILHQLLDQRKASKLSDDKWSHLRKHYSDQYRDLFKETYEESLKDGISSQLEVTQLGAVTWQPEEKARLYSALSRKGRLDLPALSELVGTKSQLEIVDWLESMHKQLTERHLFARHADHDHMISHADIPAAAEINRRCEKALEKAADALLALQDFYDGIARDCESFGSLRIDRVMAAAIDEVAEDERDDDADPSTEVRKIVDATDLFNLENFVDLSERIFMNGSGDHARENWTRLASKDETPAVIFPVIQDFSDIVTNLTRRILQSAMFLAQSRIRASRARGSLAKCTLKSSDVIAALDVLGMKQDSWQYWVGVARRNHIEVQSGSHKKGSGGVLTYEAVESALAVRKQREYHRRSRSITTDVSSEVDLEDESEIPTEDDMDVDEDRVSDVSRGSEASYRPPRTMEPRPTLLSRPTSTDRAHTHNTSQTLHSCPSSSSSSETGSSTSRSQSYTFHATTPAHTIRVARLDRHHDKYLTELDTIASRREEKRLWRILHQDRNDVDGIEQESELEAEVPKRKRPKVLRKLPDDLRDWTEGLAAGYQAEWETFGQSVGGECFAETERGRKSKKRRLDSGVNSSSG